MKSILIIEDENDLRSALQTKLTEGGYYVRSTTTSEEGLRLAMQDKPDLILLDIMTHSMHGSVFIQRLKDIDIDSKIIVLTNLDNDITKDKMKALTVTDYLIKANTSLDDLIKKISNILSESN